MHPILVLGATRPEDAELAEDLDLTLTIFQLDWLKKANEFLDRR